MRVLFAEAASLAVEEQVPGEVVFVVAEGCTANRRVMEATQEIASDWSSWGQAIGRHKSCKSVLLPPYRESSPMMSGQDRFALITLWCFRLLLAGIFLYAGLLKVLDPIGFLTVVRDFDILSDPYAAWLSMGLPWLEIMTGIALLTPWLALGGAVVAAGMLTTFIGALLSAWLRGMEIDCGCFGGGSGSDSLTSYMDIISIRVVLLVFCAVVFWLLMNRTNHARSNGAR